MNGAAPPLRKTNSTLGRIAVWGPGLLVMLADTDAGNVVTGAQAGAAWGYRFLPLLLLLIPMLYMVQELTVRLGVVTGRGYGELIRERFGAPWAWLSLRRPRRGGDRLAGDRIHRRRREWASFTGFRGRSHCRIAVVALLADRRHRLLSPRRARSRSSSACLNSRSSSWPWASHPSLGSLAKDAARPAADQPRFLYMTAAIIGAVFNPWMIFYQQSAIADKKLGLADLRAARFDTGFGAALTQCLTGAVLVTAAAKLGRHDGAGLSSIGEISNALSPVLGVGLGRAVFSAGVLGASLVAAIVCSLALAWGAGEVAGYRHSLEHRPFAAKWFYGVYGLSIVGAAAVVGLAPDLVGLNIAAQVLNALLLPLVIGLLVALAVTVLPEATRPRGVYLWLLVAIATLVIAVGVFGAFEGLFGSS